MTAPAPHGPGVRFPPPILYVIGVAGGWVLDRVMPLAISSILGDTLRIALGWVAVGLGAVGLAWAMLTFVKARTAIYPNRPARAVVEEGPYRYSRNPMYVGLAAVMVGIGLLMDTAWILLLVPVVLVALTVLVIRREEAYLLADFGKAYSDYQTRVRRWL